MKAGLFFTGTGPILIITSYETLHHPDLILKLQAKGIRKFIVYELPFDDVRETYGEHFQIVMQDLYQTDDLRVLDYNGHHIFLNFSLQTLSDPFIFDE